MSDLRAFYINLASRADRREHLERELERSGIRAERVEAVTVDDVERLMRSGELPSEALQILTPGEIACSLSHRLAWTKALEAGARAAMIFEDDAVIAPAVASIGCETLDLLRADVLKLDKANDSGARLGSRRYETGAGVCFRMLYNRQVGCAGYVATERAMKNFLQTDFQVREPVDRFIFGYDLIRRRTFQAVPALVAQLGRAPGRGDAEAARSDLVTERRAKQGYRGAARRLPPLHKRLWSNWPTIREIALRDPLALFRPAQPLPLAEFPDKDASD